MEANPGGQTDAAEVVGERIAEAVLALETGADAEDIALTIHPRPTLPETFAFAAEMIEGSIADMFVKK